MTKLTKNLQKLSFCFLSRKGSGKILKLLLELARRDCFFQAFQVFYDEISPVMELKKIHICNSEKKTENCGFNKEIRGLKQTMNMLLTCVTASRN